jgi:hypothetical protein
MKSGTGFSPPQTCVCIEDIRKKIGTKKPLALSHKISRALGNPRCGDKQAVGSFATYTN